MRLTVVQWSITDWFISTPGCGVWNRVAAVYHTVLCLQKAPSDRKNCHVAEFRQRTHRAPPGVEPGRRIRPRPTGPAGLCRAPRSRMALYAPGAARSYAAGDVTGERGVPAADRRQSSRMAGSRALPRCCGADDAADPGGVRPQPAAPETWWRCGSREFR